MPKMPVMEAAVKILESEGVDVCFGIPGAAILPLYKALSKSTKIKHLTMRHEEGATHAADGWARITGKVGVAIGTSGPAGTNMITGLYTCVGDSIPIVCITPALAWAVQGSNSRKIPVLVEIRVDRETDAAMGVAIDKIVERDPVIDLPADVPAKESMAVR